MKTKSKLNALTLLLFLTISGVSTAIFSNKAEKTITNAAVGTYYSSIDSSDSGTSLLNKLHNINTSNLKSRVGYDAMKTKFYQTDYDPNNKSNLLSFYSGKSAKYEGNMNREHTWPASRTVLGRDRDPLEDDIHMVRPTLTSENSARGNAFFVDGGNGKGTNNSNGWDPASFNNESYRGDAARIIFYCAIADTGLSLADVNYEDAGKHSMGKLSDLLKWNLIYPVQTREENRNEGAQSLQGNRNPFIDHPEYACRIWGDYNTTTQSICSQYGNIELEKISLNVNDTTLRYDETLQLKVTATPSDASTSVTWTSSHPEHATVSDTGLVTASSDSAGYTTITATSTKDSSIKAYCNITVIQPDNIDLESINATDMTLSIGDTNKINFTINPDYIYPTATYSYVSNNSEIASVDSLGNVTANSVGKTTIEITATQGSLTKKATINVEVTERKDITIELINTDFTTYASSGFTKNEIEFKTTNVMNQAGTIQFKKGSGKLSNAQELNLGSIQLINITKGSPIVYGCTSPLTTGTVITANSDGIYDLSGHKYFTVFTGSGGVCNIEKIILNISGSSGGTTPEPSPDEDSVSLNQTEANLFVGDTLALKATASGNVSWSSSNTGVATVSDSGEVTAISKGNATIKATCGKAEATCVITVNEKSPINGESITITFKNSDKDSSSAASAEEIIGLISEGSEYVSSVDDTTKLYAGTKGIKIGSSKDTGKLTLSFSDVFKSYKVVSISVISAQYGSDTGKLQLKINDETSPTSFTPGSEFTKTLTTTTSISKLTLSTSSKRAYVSSIIFNLEKNEESNTADTFAQLFIDSVGCDSTGNNKPTLSKSWNELKVIYNALSEEQKALLINAKYEYNGEVTALEGTTQIVAEAMAKYDYIVAKYGTTEYENFIVGRNIITQQLSLNRNSYNSTNNTALIMVLCFTSFLLAASFYFINRKRKQK